MHLEGLDLYIPGASGGTGPVHTWCIWRDWTCTYLVHLEGLDLALEHVHASTGDDSADVGHDAIAEHVVDELVVSLVPRRRHVLHRQTVVVICDRQ